MIASAHDFNAPGIFEYTPLLQSIVPEDEEYRPRPQKHANGEHTIEGLYPPPDSSSIVPAS
jgi:hypothetical protein